MRLPRLRRPALLVVLAGIAATSVVVAPAAQAAYPVPTAPTLWPYAEPLAGYVAPRVCATAAQPGTVAFKAMLVATYPTRPTVGTWRACSGGTAADDHQEGRALDWMLSASSASDRVLASTFLSWLFATDKYGNTYANARRLGVEYIIWNRQMWRAYNPSAGWQPYTGSVPHTDHIHISLSWAGARKQTSWWNPSISRSSPCDPATMHCNPDGTVDVLVTPGQHVVAGRQWSTRCEAYGSTGTRCFASIWATVVRWDGRRWLVTIGWVLDRLTYVDIAGPAWNGNLLAQPGRHTSAGHQWNVVCTPSASSGPRVCTDWIWVTVVAGRRTSTGGTTYAYVQKWVQASVVRLTART